MSCDFKVGDEVVCLVTKADHLGRPYVPIPRKGSVYVVTGVAPSTNHPDVILVFLKGMEWETRDGRRGGYLAKRFRKVQRRDLGEWLKTDVGNTDHIDRSVRERVGA